MAKRKAPKWSEAVQALVDEMVELQMILELGEVMPKEKIDQVVAAELRGRWEELQGHDTEAARLTRDFVGRVMADARRRQ